MYISEIGGNNPISIIKVVDVLYCIGVIVDTGCNYRSL